MCGTPSIVAPSSFVPCFVGDVGLVPWHPSPRPTCPTFSRVSARPVVRELLLRGADVLWKDGNGDTALHKAALADRQVPAAPPPSGRRTSRARRRATSPPPTSASPAPNTPSAAAGSSPSGCPRPLPVPLPAGPLSAGPLSALVPLPAGPLSALVPLPVGPLSAGVFSELVPLPVGQLSALLPLPVGPLSVLLPLPVGPRLASPLLRRRPCLAALQPMQVSSDPPRKIRRPRELCLDRRLDLPHRLLLLLLPMFWVCRIRH
ncbi:Protein of unknown function [Gryllus bimaculatus]|nr:Protein of unknown function [Gryllus bimaculatus]